ncbi:hypothetical protein [Natronospira bacteriovora]|uniref:LicD family protein n=1 Tax=Natronospira bacteriovora TaxID=3069753 RepID=A0ABU0W7I4_9GAMM|nr:hypothetical protein [Natronospira sp. AB-CW4]MDQ2069899.1 hypothetical protein [Natronospira sp. AB-CW4]
MPARIEDPEMLRVLEWVSAIARASGQPLMLDSGTLLGVQRDGELIASDDDVDLAAPDGCQETIGKALSGHGELKVWRYGRRIYKYQLKGVGLPGERMVEIKFFRPHGEDWFCPSISSRFMPDGEAQARSANPTNRRQSVILPFIKRWLRGCTDFLYALDCSRPPSSWFLRANSWVIPGAYFEQLRPLSDAFPDCMVPVDWQGYLAFRYGEWKRPAARWNYKRDDGGYRLIQPRSFSDRS